MRSPYPWHYTLRWLYYYLNPSIKNHLALDVAPRAKELLPANARTASFVFFGDLMCTHHDRVPAIGPEITAIFERADFVAGNLEAPLIFEAARPDATYFGHFAMARDFLRDFLTALHLDPAKLSLTLANNHVLDRGPEGVASTVKHLRELGVTPMGVDAVGIIERAGLRAGFAGWTHWMNDETHRKHGLVRRQSEVEREDWKALKHRERLDVLVGSPHWEYEWQHFPRAESQALAKKLFAGGFDAIVGHHPHVLQPLEMIDDRLCVYSMGNLNGPPKKRAGWPVKLIALFEMRVFAEGPNKGRIQSYVLHPFAQEITPLGEVVRLMTLEDAGPLAPLMRERLELIYR